MRNMLSRSFQSTGMEAREAALHTFRVPLIQFTFFIIPSTHSYEQWRSSVLSPPGSTEVLLVLPGVPIDPSPILSRALIFRFSPALISTLYPSSSYQLFWFKYLQRRFPGILFCCCIYWQDPSHWFIESISSLQSADILSCSSVLSSSLLARGLVSPFHSRACNKSFSMRVAVSVFSVHGVYS